MAVWRLLTVLQSARLVQRDREGESRFANKLHWLQWFRWLMLLLVALLARPLAVWRSPRGLAGAQCRSERLGNDFRELQSGNLFLRLLLQHFGTCQLELELANSSRLGGLVVELLREKES